MRGAIYDAHVGTWPVQRARVPLESFLRYPGEPLSLKAASGFFSRLERSTLRVPEHLHAVLSTYIDEHPQAR